ncbi:MAG: ferredoxin--NADP reductase [Bdellovibrionales bacterium]|nr:ferredoxin--NADP reductase [Bdellovibrionales bacterium]
MSESAERFLELRDKLTIPLKVAEKIQETPDAYSFRFDIPADQKGKFQYRAGQFVTLFLSVGDKHIRRSYSLCTSPSHDSHFQITVKQVEGGLGSNYLANQINSGDSIYVTPPQGTFFQQLERGQDAQYFFFAAGSGITPVFSIMKETLTTDPSAKAFLLFANRDEDHIIYKDLLAEIQQKFGDRLTLEHQLSQPKQPSDNAGRCDETRVKKFLEAHKTSDNVQAYLCGPDGFMDCSASALKQFGVSEDRIRTESFVTVIPAEAAATESAPAEELDGVVIGDLSAPTTKPSKIKAIINGQSVEVDVDPEISILESLINAGQNPPYSCMDGACMACMAKVTSGKVVQDDHGILTDENVEAAETLTCQARPASDNIVIDYDNL